MNGTVSKICKIDLESLIIKIREKSIKKKISFFDLFRKLDKNNDGFISFDEWMQNIGQIVQMT